MNAPRNPGSPMKSLEAERCTIVRFARSGQASRKVIGVVERS